MVGPWSGADLEPVLEWVFLAALAWPVLRIAVGFPRAEHRAGIERILGLIGATYLAGLVALLVFFPGLLRLAALGGGLVLAARLWVSRPGRGRSRGLPPGRLIPLRLAPWLDDQFYAREAARFGPIFKSMHLSRPMICVVGLERSIQLLRRFDDCLKGPFLAYNRFIPKGFLRYMSADDHKRYREWFRVAFGREVVARSEDAIADIVRSSLTEMERASPVDPGPHLERMVLRVFFRLFLGVESGSDEIGRLETLYEQLNVRNLSRDDRVQVALDELKSIIERRAREMQDTLSGGGDLPASSLETLVRLDPSLIQDPSVSGNLIYILQTGSLDLASLLRWLLKILNDNPEWKTRLEQEARSGQPASGQPALQQRIIMETLRMEQSEYLYRRIDRTFRYQNFIFPKGWRLRICIRESHQDPQVFEEPATFDPDRFLNRQYHRSQYSPFGASRIACLGVHFTYAVGAVFLRQLSRHHEWAVLSDGDRKWGGWHWRPSPRLRIGLTRRKGVSDPGPTPGVIIESKATGA